MKKLKAFTTVFAISSALLLGACDSSGKSSNESNEETTKLSGSVVGDGSSTVAPILEALSEEYKQIQPNVNVSVGVSGTGGGFEKFIAGETDFNNASRLIKDEEAQKLKEANIEYTEFPIANDGITIVVHPENDWATDLTVEQLKEIWIEDGKEKKWSDINPSWPKEKIVYYSPGTDSGTFDYFSEVILEDEDLVKSATLSEDDNVLVQGVSSDKYAIGFFGFAYYVENKDKLKAIKINGVEPSNATIESGEYTPFSRTLYIYAKNKALKENEAFYDFMKFSIENASKMAEAVGYVQLPEEKYGENLSKLEKLK